MAAVPLILAAVSLVSVATDGDAVRAEFFGESGCPFCRAFIAGPLKTAFETPGIPEIMDFEYFPWGNAYFVTSECGGAGGYNSTARQCFNRVCGRDATNRSADCFTGQLICQHGEAECQGNQYLTCAKQVTQKVATKYLPFVTCVEAEYDGTHDASDPFWSQLYQKCASSSGLDYDALLACTKDASSQLEVEQAQATPEHPGVPYVVVGGQPVSDTDQFVQAVCAAYQGASRPAACSAAQPRFVV